MVAALVRLTRPKQWIKNVLVLAAPGAAGVLDDAGPLADTVLAFVAFCLAAGGTYCLNDARDAEADRHHPAKRRRPVASGEVAPAAAYGLGAVLVAAACAVAASVRWELVVVVAGYVGLTTAYTLWLKRVAVVDVAAVAAGFVLRAVGGAVAADVPISDWFFIVTTFGSLLMVTGKRGAEAAEVGDIGPATRSVLADYTPAFTAYLRSVSSSAVLVAYCLWAFERAGLSDEPVPWHQLSIVPFAVGVFRYALVLDQGRGAAPEEIVLGDRPLQVVGLVWAVLFGLGVYLA